MNRWPIHILLLTALFLLNCQGKKKAKARLSTASEGAKQQAIKVYEPKYAKGFRIHYFERYKQLEVLEASTGEVLFTYYSGEGIPDHIAEQQAFYKPPERIACSSTTHVAFLSSLQLTDNIKGMAGAKYIQQERLRERIADGKVEELGLENALNKERLIRLAPDIFLAYYSGNADYDQLQRLRELGQKTVVIQEFRERHPLGQTEWIVFLSAFFNKEPLAIAYFKEVEASYRQTMERVPEDNLPEVFTGLAYRGQWTIPGGKSFAARFIRHAGGRYVWEEDSSQGNLVVDFEAAYKKAAKAAVWINTGSAESLDEIKGVDERYQFFSAWQQGNVFNNNARVNEHGGNDYWESGVVNPHIVLRDLVKIFHPEQLPSHDLYYYKQLN